jgi:GNAT superfamily N-acetyltransferase
VIQGLAQAPLVRRVGSHDRDAVLSLWEQYYGPTDEGMVDAAIGSDNGRVHGYVADVDGSVVGFAIATIAEKDWINGRFDVEIEEHVSHRLNGVLFQVVVEPAYRGRGIGTRLTRQRIHWLATHEVELHHVLAVCWVREDGPDARGIVERFGLEEVEYIDREPVEDHPCPDCDGVCDCDGALHIAPIEEVAWDA